MGFCENTVNKKVTVIIPAYNRGDKLAVTLRSLVNQTLSADMYEIIVADNNSTDNTASVVENAARTSPVPIRYLMVRKQGVHYARNAAAHAARGDLLYFTDDDMEADGDMLRQLTGVFDLDARIACATGRVLPKWEVPPVAWIIRHFADGNLSLQQRSEALLIAPYDMGVWSCHQMVRKDVLFRTAGFHPENTCGEWVGDGETGLNHRILSMGYLFAFIGAAVTYHMIPPERMTQVYMNRRLANQGCADSYTAYRRYCSRRVLVLGLPSHLLEWVCSTVAAFCLKIRGQDRWHVRAARRHYFLARLRYDMRLLADYKWRAFVLRDDWLSSESTVEP